MSPYVRLDSSFWTHRKTLRLHAAIGVDAYWVPQRLWCYAATHQPNGDFSKYSAPEIAQVIGYTGNADELLKCLLASGFMDKGPKIHNWDFYNGFHAIYKNRAQKAAKSRWDKASHKNKREEESTGEYSTGEDKHRNCATSTNDASAKYRNQD